MNTSDSGAMGDLEKIQRLSIQVIEKAANAKAMIALAIFAKKLAKGEELFDSKFRPFEPSPIVQKEILEGVQRVLESGDFEKP